MSRLKLPKVDFYQLKINYDTLTIEKAEPASAIATSADSARIADSIIKTTDLSMDKSKTSIHIDDTEYGTEPATFNSWIYRIMKGGFGSPAVQELMQYAEQLNSVYQKSLTEKNGSRYYVRIQIARW